MASPLLRGVFRPARHRGRRLVIWVALMCIAAYLFLFGFMEPTEEPADDLFGDDVPVPSDHTAKPTPSKRPKPPSRPTEPKKTTTWPMHQNGKIYVQVNDAGEVESPKGIVGKPKHPILELVQGAEKHWNDMVRRQSKTLADAVKEYHKRYGRLPPKGFDKWFEFAKKNNVILIDEFDQIDHDIAPYLAIQPRAMQQRITKLETHKDSYHLIISGGNLTYTNTPVRDVTRITDMVELVEEFVQYLPDMEVHASLHDTGSHVLREDYRQKALQKLEERDYLSKEDLKFFEDKKTNPRKRVTKACLDNTPAVHEERGAIHEKTSGKSMEFIEDHVTSMNFCYNPEILASHGSFIWDLARDSFLEPFFVGCKLAQGPEILMPALVGFGDTREDEKPPAWSTRKAKAFWRGSTTGNHFRINDWKRSHRIALHFLTNAQDGQEPILLDDAKKGLASKVFPKKDLNEHYMDIGLVGKPIQCEQKDGTCDAMAKNIDWKPRAALNLGSQYKYALDVDGNGWSQRYRRLLSSGSVILKSTIFPEWNSHWLIPWYHYVPLQVDYSDLYNIMAFFTGSPDGTSSDHDKLAERISQNSIRFVRENGGVTSFSHRCSDCSLSMQGLSPTTAKR